MRKKRNHLTILSKRHIMVVIKKDAMCIEHKQNPLECQLQGVFCSFRRAVPFGLVPSFIPVQPLADIVASYSCQYRDKERCYVLH